MNRTSDSLPIAFAAWHKDLNVRKHCTSGGVATALAEMTIAKGGIVVGAAYGDDLSVRHVIVDDQDGINRIRGVKYVQSYIGRDIYERMSWAMECGRRVLFIGLPCQVAAMRKRFGMNDNLLLVDLICFGAPAQNLWRKYVAWLEDQKGKRLVYIDPRDKKKGWRHKTYYRYDWADGSVEWQLSLFDPYAQAFYSGIAFRPCCYQCQFRGDDGRMSDLTVGDCWGAEQVGALRYEVLAGVSCVVIHNEGGGRALRELAVRLVDIEKRILVKENVPYFSSPIRRPESIAFAQDAERLTFDQLIQKYSLCVSKYSYLRAVSKRAVKLLLRLK